MFSNVCFCFPVENGLFSEALFVVMGFLMKIFYLLSLCTINCFFFFKFLLFKHILISPLPSVSFLIIEFSVSRCPDDVTLGEILPTEMDDTSSGIFLYH